VKQANFNNRREGGAVNSAPFFMDILNFINTVGFPIFVAVFFLLKLDNTLQNIGKNLNELTRIIETKLNLDISNK
jgi:hypothetical protein